jgi:hypothetical protein
MKSLALDMDVNPYLKMAMGEWFHKGDCVDLTTVGDAM